MRGNSQTHSPGLTVLPLGKCTMFFTIVKLWYPCFIGELIVICTI